jgi:hypothetical protein
MIFIPQHSAIQALFSRVTSSRVEKLNPWLIVAPARRAFFKCVFAL